MKRKRQHKYKSERSPSDTISTLPETVLEAILCLLPTKEAARTSILSREWRYKWTYIPKLEFYLSDVSGKITNMNQVQGKNMGARRKAFHRLRQILSMHRGPIQEFTLNINLWENYVGLNRILFHLSKNHRVKKLTLVGVEEDHGFDLDKLPISVFSFHHLTDLSLSLFDVDLQPTFNGFGSLRSLHLCGMKISTEILLHLLSNSPSLKSLTLLIYESNSADRDCTIIDLFKCLPMIERLTTCGDVFQWLVLVPVPQELPPLLFHLKYFCIEEFCFAKGQALGFLLVLIKCSPNLEKVKLQFDDFHDCIEEYSIVWEEYSNVWLEHLTELEIEIYDFPNLKPEMELVKFILARSPNLKNVRIQCWQSRETTLKMLQVLLQAPHSSPNLCLEVAGVKFRSVSYLWN